MKNHIKVLSVILVIFLTFSVSFTANAEVGKPKSVSITAVYSNKNEIAVKWKKVSNISGYQLQYSTNSKFKKAKSVKIKSKKTAKKIKKLKSGKKYFIRIRAYKVSNNKITNGSWSKKRSITTKQSTTTTKRCTNNNNHSMQCGNIGKWFNSRSELTAYYNNIAQSWNNKYASGEITIEELMNNAPGGYECWSCSHCGKWSGNFKYR